MSNSKHQNRSRKAKIAGAATVFGALVVMTVSPALAGGNYSTWKTCNGITNVNKEIASHVKGSGSVRATTPRATRTITSGSVIKNHQKDPSLKEGTVSGSTTLTWSYGHGDCDY